MREVEWTLAFVVCRVGDVSDSVPKNISEMFSVFLCFIFACAVIVQDGEDAARRRSGVPAIGRHCEADVLLPHRCTGTSNDGQRNRTEPN